MADAEETRADTIELVIETHFHADFLSGHLELAKATGAQIGVLRGRRDRVRVDGRRTTASAIRWAT